MRNSTIIALGLAAVMAMPAAADTFSPLKLAREVKTQFFSTGECHRINAQRLQSTRLQMSEIARKLKPGTTKTFGWNGRKWMTDDIYTYTYDKEGKVTVEICRDAEGEYSRTVNEYDGNGMVVFKETMTSRDGVDYDNNKKTEFEYDPILTDVITKRTEWMWMNNDWQLIGNNYRRIIVRDEQGNITSVVIAVLFNGEYDPTQRLNITYGEDGTATEISEQILDYDGKEYFWEDGEKLTNIEWEKTNGQIYDVESIFIGDNRIKSGTIEDPDGTVMDVSVEYSDQDESFSAWMSMTESGITIAVNIDYTPLENDGYMAVVKTIFLDAVIGVVTEEVRYDDWGLMTLQSEKEESYDGGMYSESIVGEVEYDSEGKPEIYTVSEHYTDDSGEEEIDYMIRAEYSDYIDVTAGINGPDTEYAPVRYYNLQGMPVSVPGKGQIIVTESGAKMAF